MTVKNLSYVKFKSLRPLYLVIDQANRYIEESNGNRCLTPIPTNEGKDSQKKHEETMR